jgi:hypothetical protein
MKPTLFKIWLRSELRVAAYRTWRGTLSNAQIHLILKDTWKRYPTLARALGKQPNLRTWFTMSCACLTLAAFHSMLELGFEPRQAVELIAALTWKVTSTVTWSVDRVSHLVFWRQPRRMKALVNLAMSLLFCKPAYRTEKCKLEGGFTMDVHSCPVAEYLIANGAGELCVSAWCGVDPGLVELLGGRLERRSTIAMGEEFCDFKFYYEGR